MKRAMTNMLLLSGLFGLLGLPGFVGPALDEQDHPVAVEESAKAQRQERFEHAARQVCGENASYRITHKHGEIICLTKRGHKTGKSATL